MQVVQQFSKMENMDDGGEPNLLPAALVNLLAAGRVSSLVRFVLVPIFHEELSYLLHASSEFKNKSKANISSWPIRKRSEMDLAELQT